jgi:hypothetical protein
MFHAPPHPGPLPHSADERGEGENFVRFVFFLWPMDLCPSVLICGY